MSDAPRPCETDLDLVGFKYPLSHLVQSLKRHRKTRIVAIGSSSTAGEGNIVPYPHRLELALRGHNYGRMIDVLNRGIGGQEAQDELARFEADVIGEASSPAPTRCFTTRSTIRKRWAQRSRRDLIGSQASRSMWC